MYDVITFLSFEGFFNFQLTGVILAFMHLRPDEVASVWMPAKACHDFIMIYFVLALPDFIPHVYKDSNLISDLTLVDLLNA